MLAVHNQVRACASPAPVPELPALSWSNTVAATAQAWADQCSFAHNPNRGALGENIFGSTNATGAGAVVNLWASEAANYNFAANTCATGEVCGHYTQLVWRSTTTLGCASKACTSGGPFGGGPWYFVVCDYSPPGNFNGQRPY